MLNKIIYADGPLSKVFSPWIDACDFKLGRWDELMLLALLAFEAYRCAAWIVANSHFTLWDCGRNLWVIPIVYLVIRNVRRRTARN